MYLFLKAAISGVLVATASEAARRSPHIGGLIASLPLVSVLAWIWLWRETNSADAVASLAQSTFWFVLPSLPMFFVLPALLKHGIGFWLSLAIACLITIVLYATTFWLLSRLGIEH
jgi:hypothetical protein